MSKLTRRKVEIVKSIKAKGYPFSSPYYRASHEKANQAEKVKHPRIYRQLDKVIKGLKPDEAIGTHDRKGNIKIESKVPKRDRKDIELHEDVERKEDARLKRKTKK